MGWRQLVGAQVQLEREMDLAVVAFEIAFVPNMERGPKDVANSDFL
jgi:hypothetical protein